MASSCGGQLLSSLCGRQFIDNGQMFEQVGPSPTVADEEDVFGLVAILA